MSAGRYLVGIVALALVAAPMLVAGVRLAGRLLPGSDRAERALAGLVLALAGIILTAEAVGAVGQFRLVPYVASCVVVAATAILFTKPANGAPHPTIPAAGTPWLRLLAIAAVAIVVTQWSLAALGAFRHGIDDADSQHYHLSHGRVSCRTATCSTCTTSAPTTRLRSTQRTRRRCTRSACSRSRPTHYRS